MTGGVKICCQRVGEGEFIFGKSEIFTSNRTNSIRTFFHKNLRHFKNVLVVLLYEIFCHSPVTVFSSWLESVENEAGSVPSVYSPESSNLVFLLDAEPGSEVSLLPTEKLFLNIVPVQLNAFVGHFSNNWGVGSVWKGNCRFPHSRLYWLFSFPFPHTWRKIIWLSINFSNLTF